MLKITREMYRDALHIYLKHAYPEDDGQYYSKWAWMAIPNGNFWNRGIINPKNIDGDKEMLDIPREVRFGCHVSSNCKLRAYPTGFYFDPNWGGDPDDICAVIKKIKEAVEQEWERVGLPVHEKTLSSTSGAKPDASKDE